MKRYKGKKLVDEHLQRQRPIALENQSEPYFIPNYSGVANKLNSGTEELGWEDLRFPFSGLRLDSNSTRYSYDYVNGLVCFNSNSRYPNEPISMIAQLPHSWKEESQVRPHMHWIQTSSDQPNWLLAYRIYKNGDGTSIDSDYSNYNFLTVESNVFPYASGNLVQISNFGMIDMTGVGLSDCIHFVVFRDVFNTSGEFERPESSESNAYSIEFDIHYQSNSLGSREEFIK